MIGTIQRSWPMLLTGVLAVSFLSCVGCSDNYNVEVTGSVSSSGGTPIPRARVIFRSSDDNSFQARAVTDTEGHYKLIRNEQVSKIPPGKYDVLIAPVQTLGDPVVGFEAIPLKYSNFDTSGLQVEVTPEQTVYDFVIESKRD